MARDEIRDDDLRAYLFGHARPEIEDAIETRLLSDDNGIAERLAALEGELIDDRIRPGSSAPARRQFDKGFQWTTRRRRRLGVATGLSGLTTDEIALAWQADRREGWGTRMSRWLVGRLPSPAWVPAAVAVLVLVSSLGAWMAARLTGPGVPLPVTLSSANAVRGAGTPEVRVRTGSRGVRLRLEIPADAAASGPYEARLHVMDGGDEVILVRRRLVPDPLDGGAVSLAVEADLVRPGSYYVELIGSATPAGAGPVVRYPFTVAAR